MNKQKTEKLLKIKWKKKEQKLMHTRMYVHVHSFYRFINCDDSCILFRTQRWNWYSDWEWLITCQPSVLSVPFLFIIQIGYQKKHTENLQFKSMPFMNKCVGIIAHWSLLIHRRKQWKERKENIIRPISINDGMGW